MGFGDPGGSTRSGSKRSRPSSTIRNATARLVSQAKYDDKLRHEQDAAAAGRHPGPLERFKRWFSARV